MPAAAAAAAAAAPATMMSPNGAPATSSAPRSSALGRLREAGSSHTPAMPAPAAAVAAAAAAADAAGRVPPPPSDKQRALVKAAVFTLSASLANRRGFRDPAARSPAIGGAHAGMRLPGKKRPRASSAADAPAPASAATGDTLWRHLVHADAPSQVDGVEMLSQGTSGVLARLAHVGSGAAGRVRLTLSAKASAQAFNEAVGAALSLRSTLARPTAGAAAAAAAAAAVGRGATSDDLSLLSHTGRAVLGRPVLHDPSTEHNVELLRLEEDNRVLRNRQQLPPSAETAAALAASARQWRAVVQDLYAKGYQEGLGAVLGAAADVGRAAGGEHGASSAKLAAWWMSDLARARGDSQPLPDAHVDPVLSSALIASRAAVNPEAAAGLLRVSTSLQAAAQVLGGSDDYVDGLDSENITAAARTVYNVVQQVQARATAAAESALLARHASAGTAAAPPPALAEWASPELLALPADQNEGSTSMPQLARVAQQLSSQLAEIASSVQAAGCAVSARTLQSSAEHGSSDQAGALIAMRASLAASSAAHAALLQDTWQSLSGREFNAPASSDIRHTQDSLWQSGPSFVIPRGSESDLAEEIIQRGHIPR